MTLCLLSGLMSSVAETDAEETFAEELYLKPLSDGKVLAYAQFTTLSGRYVHEYVYKSLVLMCHFF